MRKFVQKFTMDEINKNMSLSTLISSSQERYINKFYMEGQELGNANPVFSFLSLLAYNLIVRFGFLYLEVNTLFQLAVENNAF